MARPGADGVRSACSASDFTMSSCALADRPWIAYRIGAPDGPALACTLPPWRHARLRALNALFSAGSTTRTGPDPVMRPSGGTMPADAGSVSKPTPGRLSNGAASFSRAASYRLGFSFTPGSPPMTFIFPAASSLSGEVAGTTRTPIWSGSDQPAASYGRSGGPPGYSRRSGYDWTSRTSRAIAANSWSVGTTQVPAGNVSLPTVTG